MTSKVVGQCKVDLKVGPRDQQLSGTVIIMDIPSKHPLLGRDILTDMSITFDKLLKQSSVKATSLEQSAIEEIVITCLKKD